MMQPWFPDAKLGIFIHYGIYAVKGIPESWSFFHGQISYEDYMSQLGGFTASKYDPEAWADLFERSGARYAVLTTKHHDGVALWDTHASDLSVVKKTPAGRDLVGPFCRALRKHGLKVGLYFSQLDWSHPDYATVCNAARNSSDDDPEKRNRFSEPRGEEDPAAWGRFIRFHRAQLQELAQQYHPDLWWFDGDWERSPEQFDFKGLRELLHQWQPNVILNSRMGGYGDYATPEQGSPLVRPDGPWEFCMTINDSWGYQVQDHNHKSPEMIVRIFCECIGRGGNLLLDVGPNEDGSILPEQIERLEALGRWIAKHKEAIFETDAGLPPGYLYGQSTIAKDRSALYAFFFGKPRGEMVVQGLVCGIKRVSVVGSGQTLQHRVVGGAAWVGLPGQLLFDLPEDELDPLATVVKIEPEGPLKVWDGHSMEVEVNAL